MGNIRKKFVSESIISQGIASIIKVNFPALKILFQTISIKSKIMLIKTLK